MLLNLKKIIIEQLLFTIIIEFMNQVFYWYLDKFIHYILFHFDNLFIFRKESRVIELQYSFHA